jgi:hypothetical protein
MKTNLLKYGFLAAVMALPTTSFAASSAGSDLRASGGKACNDVLLCCIGQPIVSGSAGECKTWDGKKLKRKKSADGTKWEIDASAAVDRALEDLGLSLDTLTFESTLTVE